MPYSKKYKRLKEEVPFNIITCLVKHGLGGAEKVKSAIFIRGGLFNTSYRINLGNGGVVVLRIAPPSDKKLLGVEEQLLRREVYITKRMSGYNLLLPKVLSCDFSGKLIDRDYAICEYKEGHNAFYHQRYLTPAQLDYLYGELGEYASRIHSVENKEHWFGYPPPFSPHKTWGSFIKAYMLSLQQDMQGHPYLSFPEDVSLPVIAERMLPLLEEVKVPMLIHGDLWLRNILIQKQGEQYKISAILDWDRSLWGEPYFEWILYGTEPHQSFWQSYGRTMPEKNTPAYLRVLLYKACGALQAALEDSIHFGLKKNSLTMLGYAERDFAELSERI